MANTTLTANMSLIIPTPGSDPGPDYANNNNQDFTILDAHNHGPGSGVQITPAGLNINTNLSFQNNIASNVYGVQFSSPAANSTNLTFLYTAPQSGGGINDLFYNDGAGNVVALTKAGLVNATIASLPGESYAGGTFTWKQGTGSTTPANFDIGSVTIRPNTAGTSNGVVVGPPSGISSQYNVQLPTVPGSNTGIMQIDTSGNMLSTLVPDNSTITISSQVLQVPPNGITSLQLNLPGFIAMYGGAAAPSNWLLCDGTSYLRTAYPNLFSAIGTAYGAADGTHFNVPDFRGIFPRGVTGSTANDPDASSRTAQNTGGNSGNNVGSIQANAYTSHTHATTVSGSDGSFGGAYLSASPTGAAGNIISSTPYGSGGPSGGNTSTETRPINLYVNFIIKT